MKYLLLIMCLVITPVYAGGDHHHPEPTNVPDGGSNHNVLAIGIVVVAGILCWKHRCLESKEDVKVSDTITPEIPQNEYVRIRRETKP